jgi:hypothetical protein
LRKKRVPGVSAEKSWSAIQKPSIGFTLPSLGLTTKAL